MGMTMQQFSILAKGMKSIYPDPKFIADEFAMEIWFNMLSDLDYELANLAIQKHIQTNRFPPTVADIRENAVKLTTGPEMTSEEAWAKVKKAVRNSIYHAREEFEMLPEICQRAVGSPENLREMGLMDSSELNTVQKSLFVKTYNTTSASMKEQAQLTDNVKALIANTLEKLPG